MNYRPDIDGLRAVAVIPVVLFHAGFTGISGGFAGVDVFFVISGYLITSILLKESDRETFNLVDFYRRRARRLLPALFLVLGVTLLVGSYVFSPDKLLNLSLTSIFSTFSVSNIYLFLQQGYFAPDAKLNPLMHTWSLGVEEQYYIFFPLLVIFIKSRRIIFTIILLASLASFIASEMFSGIYFDAAYYLLPFRAWELGVGAMLAFSVYIRMPMENLSSALQSLGLILIIFSFFYITPQTQWPSKATLLPVFGTLMVLAWSGNRNSLVLKLLSCKLVVYLGLISYSLYLVHQPIIAFAKFLFPSYSQDIKFSILLILISIACASLSYEYVETPFRSNKISRRSSRVAWMAPIVITILGGWLIFTDGLKYRYDASVIEFLTVNDRANNSKFVSENYNNYLNVPFPENVKENLLIIGDSYSQDLFNSLTSTGVLNNYNISTSYVNSRCQFYMSAGNEPKGDLEYLSQRNKQFCTTLRHRLRSNLFQFGDSDIIIVANHWKYWAASEVNGTLKRMGLRKGQRMFVLGTKEFPKPDLEALSQLDQADRKNISFTPESNVFEINHIISERIGASLFIDQMQLFCPSGQCQLLPNGINLVSYDGFHLTPKGAEQFGEIFLENTPLKCLKNVSCLYEEP